ncbi:MAG: dual specificity protein phosphatase family protein [Myxococcota bacterium]
MLRNFSYLQTRLLAGVARPGPDLKADLAELRRVGIGALLSLTETPVDLRELEAAGLVSRHAPIRDYAAPEPELLDDLVAWIGDQQHGGRAVAVHCAAGLGRTGTVLAACLVAEGASAAEAVDVVRKSRPGSIETDEQVAAVHAFARRVAERSRPG